MCDTIVATPSASSDGAVLFGKNSDREPNEAHHVLTVPAEDHSPGSRVACTYIDIPQARHTHAVLLAKPFWIWGAEMGTNEHGLVIGNEAVFTKEPYDKGKALTGMDLLRLALERAVTAQEAIDIITRLIAEYGQGGNCGFAHKLFYHNSFLMADSREAWVLETAGGHWAAKRVEGVYTISNGLTIGTEWDMASPGLVDHAIEKGWCRNPSDFHFARCYSDFLYTRFSCCRERRTTTMGLLHARADKLTVSDFTSILRDHHFRSDRERLPERGITGSSVCMHAGFGPIRGSQTTGSMVSHLRPDRPTHFVTGTAAPCTGIFRPVWLDAGFPDMGPVPKGTYDAASIFWRHERLHRAVLRDFPARIETYREDRDTIEGRFITEALECTGQTVSERNGLSARCFAEADRAEERWLERVADIRSGHTLPFFYELAWKGFNRAARMPDLP